MMKIISDTTEDIKDLVSKFELIEEEIKSDISLLDVKKAMKEEIENAMFSFLKQYDWDKTHEGSSSFMLEDLNKEIRIRLVFDRKLNIDAIEKCELDGDKIPTFVENTETKLKQKINMRKLRGFSKDEQEKFTIISKVKSVVDIVNITE